MNRSLAIDLIACREPRTATMVGWEILKSATQTPGGVQSEMSRINDDFVAFDKEIGDYVASQPGYPHSDPRPVIEKFYASVWSPFMQNWQGWYGGHNGWWQNLWWNHSPDAEEFLRQLEEMRKAAVGLGMEVHSPSPYKPPESPLKGPLDLLEKIVWFAIAIAGFAVVVMVLKA